MTTWTRPGLAGVGVHLDRGVARPARSAAGRGHRPDPRPDLVDRASRADRLGHGLVQGEHGRAAAGGGHRRPRVVTATGRRTAAVGDRPDDGMDAHARRRGAAARGGERERSLDRWRRRADPLRRGADRPDGQHGTLCSPPAHRTCASAGCAAASTPCSSTSATSTLAWPIRAAVDELVERLARLRHPGDDPARRPA